MEEQYRKGSIGYMIFPYYITSLLKLDAEKWEEFEKIIDLASELELPNKEGETNPVIRSVITEKLAEKVRNL